MENNHKVVLSLGSNMGDSISTIRQAVGMISDYEGVASLKASGLYETEPVGYEDQPSFINACVLIETTLSPYEVLDMAHEIEQAFHRERIIRWGPRTLDVDVILYDDLIMDDEDLTIPHPRYLERAFVLMPMSELVPFEGEIPTDKGIKLIDERI